jgi:hypothetical protein
MNSIAAAWASYVAAVAMIYAIGDKASDFLNDETLQRIATYTGDHPVSRTLEVIAARVTATIDNVMKFRYDGILHVPSFPRSLVLTTCFLLLACYPLRDYLQVEVPERYAPPTIKYDYESFSVFDVNIWIMALLLATFFITNAVSDFISFSKTRTIITWLPRYPLILRMIAIGAFDVLSSLIIAFFVSGWVSGLPSTILAVGAYWLYGAPIFIICLWFTYMTWTRVPTIALIAMNLFALEIADVILLLFFGTPNDVTTTGGAIYNRNFKLDGTFTFAAFTSLGISGISILAYCIEMVRRGAQRIEAITIWRVLDFARSPSRAAAVIVIVIFTVIYWPIVLLTDLL